MDRGGADATAASGRPRKRTGRRARGLHPVERDGHWHCVGTLRARGRSIRVRRSLGIPAGARSEDLAWDAVREIEAEILAEISGEGGPGAYVAVAAQDYLSQKRTRALGKTTVDVIQEIAGLFGLRRLNDIAPDEWKRHVETRQKDNSPATRERYLNALLAFLSFCRTHHRLKTLPTFQRDKIARNPLRRTRRRIRELRPDLIARLLMSAHITIRAQLAVEWSAGARVSSVLHGCRVCDLILAEGREQLTFHDTKNGTSVDAVLHPTAAAILRDYVAWRGKLHEREAPLFLTYKRLPYADTEGAWGGQNKTGFNAAKRRAAASVLADAEREASRITDPAARAEILAQAEADAALLRSVTQHWFRHMLASRMVREGDLRTAMEQGGWLDPRSIMGYTHDAPEHRRRAVHAFDDFGTYLTRDASEKKVNG
ncbi:tyrosine-type recombinase/integrase [Microvirga tunisiensis]|uniref:Tyrosine-type recombinase/integrase n=1 Tax=Pannonibacter tanglangensis TaxID=2750084 RepID=A0A7X5F568_9HYPH|nr:tyrosine-type recombinase/integrase [Pannonibacter sp. XCT-53]NBN78714.1 tyrosine-type recombinase/integrase [Pannonibacter sp. XCT-53]